MTETATPDDDALFTATEVQQFEADDVVAGSAIGKMLSALFLYTVLAMSFVAWWTFSTVSETRSLPANTADHSGH
ncbi:MAG TPA: hypothetical protein EYG03_26295 [Planctomycetes bacterium]|nr:hypothetical protein [Fuerstiella sp.]HIK95471.1 hypothetical protein [Planctomycetota bacterium]